MEQNHFNIKKIKKREFHNVYCYFFRLFPYYKKNELNKYRDRDK